MDKILVKISTILMELVMRKIGKINPIKKRNFYLELSLIYCKLIKYLFRKLMSILYCFLIERDQLIQILYFKYFYAINK